MEKFAASRNLQALWEKPSFPALGGVPLDEHDVRPRQDYGPIGSRPRDSWDNEKVSVRLINDWASDYIQPGGALKSEAVRGTGLVPCLPNYLKIVRPGCNSSSEASPQTSPEAGVKNSPGSSKNWSSKSSNRNDMAEFVERFGIYGSPRASVLKTPTRAKYYKKFTS